MIIHVSMVELPYEDLLALLEQAYARIAVLETELAAAQAKLGKNSTNSSTPPSQDSIGAKAERKAKRKAKGKVDRSQRVRSKERKRGGQPGHPGAGLTPTTQPKRTEQVDPPAECGHCGGDLADGVEAVGSWAQVWDIPPVALEKLHYLLPRLACPDCGKHTTAAPPWGQAGAVCYGPNVNAAAILLASQGNVPVEATAGLMSALLGAPVSTGFVARAHERLADILAAKGFDQAMVAALRSEPVLCADETPVNVVNNVDGAGEPTGGQPHVATVRTPDPRLVWYKDISSRSSEELAGLGVFNGWSGFLVRDDYKGYHQFDAKLAGVQLCCSHLIRSLEGVLDLDRQVQQWAAQAQKALREAAELVEQAEKTGTRIDPVALAQARLTYDRGVAVGISINLSRPWPKGNHPGLVLAQRLKKKAKQVWLFTTNPAVPWTNNPSEQALRGPKRHQTVSGYWQTTLTLSRFCRVRSYLVSARNHGLTAIEAIHTALAGKPWLPLLA